MEFGKNFNEENVNIPLIVLLCTDCITINRARLLLLSRNLMVFLEMFCPDMKNSLARMAAQTCIKSLSKLQTLCPWFVYSSVLPHIFLKLPFSSSSLAIQKPVDVPLLCLKTVLLSMFHCLIKAWNCGEKLPSY